MKAIILAAGYATRMYPLTQTKPKSLLKLGGRAIVDYIIDQINTLPSVDEIIVVSNSKFFDQFEAWHKTAKSNIPISLLDDGSLNEHDRLGAIGDISFTIQAKEVDDDVVIIAGDNYTTYPLLEQYEMFKNKNSDVVCAKRIDDPEALKQFAVATLDENNKITSLVEKPSEPASDIAIFATYFYQRETLPLFAQYLAAGQPYDAPGNFPQWLYQKKDIYAYIMNGDCFDIGTIKVYEEMRRKFEG